MKVPRPVAGLSGALVLLAAALFGCWPKSPRAIPHDVLVVTIDTARADRFSYAGPSPVATPAADALADDGVAFLQAIASAPITLVSHASLFTGQYPPRHGVRNNGTFRLPSEAVTLAELAKERGFATAAFLGASVLDARYGLDQGFDTYDDEMVAGGLRSWGVDRRAGEQVVRAALAWLDEQDGRPTFVWVHLFDPHAPYQPPEPERSRYANAYDAAIAYADRVLGVLLDGYRSRGRYAGALVVMAADHGESLGEHGEVTHGVFVYDSVVRVPLVIRVPGLPGGRRVERQVALVDVFPTILTAIGSRAPGDIDGVDLTPLLAGKPPAGPPRPVYIESYYPYLTHGWSPFRGLRTEAFKLIEGVAPELYHLPSDPQELDDVSGDRPEQLAALDAQLEAIAPGDAPVPGGTLEMDAETREQLAALGYVWIDPRDRPAGEKLPDPHERIALDALLAKAYASARNGDLEAAIETLRDIAAQDPGNLFVLNQLARVEREAGHDEAAAETFGHLALLTPNNAANQENWGVALERTGRFEQAIDAYTRALRAEPRRASARSHRWRLLEQQGRLPELYAELQGLVAENPEDGQAMARLIQLRHRGDPRGELVASLEAAHAEHPDLYEITAALALALYREGDHARAEELFREVLVHEPGHHNASVVVGAADLSRGEIREARSILETAARRHGEYVPVLRLLAEARRLSGDLEGANRVIEDAIRLEPDRSDLWVIYATISFDQGRWSDSVARYRRAAALGADDPIVRTNLSAALRALGGSAGAEGG